MRRSGSCQFVQIARGNGKEIIPTFDNFSAFAQDTWTVNPRLTLTYGLRYELNPAPGSANDTLPLVFEDITAPLVEFAPEGTRAVLRRGTRTSRRASAWPTGCRSGRPGNGAARRRRQLLRHRLWRGGASCTITSFPYFLSKTVGNAPNVPYPLTAEQAAAPDPATIIPQQFWQMDRNVKTPYTLQWNTSIEQSLGRNQTVSGDLRGLDRQGPAAARDLEHPLADYIALYPTSRVSTSLTKNGGRGNYHGSPAAVSTTAVARLPGARQLHLVSSKDTGLERRRVP